MSPVPCPVLSHPCPESLAPPSNINITAPGFKKQLILRSWFWKIKHCRPISNLVYFHSVFRNFVIEHEFAHAFVLQNRTLIRICHVQKSNFVWKLHLLRFHFIMAARAQKHSNSTSDLKIDLIFGFRMPRNGKKIRVCLIVLKFKFYAFSWFYRCIMSCAETQILYYLGLKIGLRFGVGLLVPKNYILGNFASKRRFSLRTFSIILSQHLRINSNNIASGSKFDLRFGFLAKLYNYSGGIWLKTSF